ncbi:MAG: hypothetical protein AB8G05_08920 [Oligoflexales bacterium]
MRFSVQQAKSLKELWREFIPLSLSDIMMAFSDPLMTATLAHLPGARANIASLGIVKSLIVFFESPIIMILHASTALSGHRQSRKYLGMFTFLACLLLSGLLLVLGIPLVFNWFGTHFLGIDEQMLQRTGSMLVVMFLWPAVIGWRRFFQGILIQAGQSRALAKASMMRISYVVLSLALGFTMSWQGTTIIGVSLLGSIFVEALVVTFAAYVSRAIETYEMPKEKQKVAPKSFTQVLKYYLPLANSMLVVWGGRFLLVAVIARSIDGSLSLAVWPASWGVVLLIANATRMVQQVIIKNRSTVADGILAGFSISVGALFSIVLLLIPITSLGHKVLEGFLGNDKAMVAGVSPVILICTIVPFLVAVQNALQGFLMSEGKTKWINTSTWLGTGVLLFAAGLGVSQNFSGSIVAAFAMVLALITEISMLSYLLLSKNMLIFNEILVSTNKHQIAEGN